MADAPEAEQTRGSLQRLGALRTGALSVTLLVLLAKAWVS